MTTAAKVGDDMVEKFAPKTLTFCFRKECEDNDLSSLGVAKAIAHELFVPHRGEADKTAASNVLRPGFLCDAQAGQPGGGDCVLSCPPSQVNERGGILDSRVF